MAAHRKTPETTTIAEAARRLNIGKNQCYEAAHRGELPVIKIGRRWLIPTAALDRLLLQRPRQLERNRERLSAHRRNAGAARRLWFKTECHVPMARSAGQQFVSERPVNSASSSRRLRIFNFDPGLRRSQAIWCIQFL
jgi:excisionase family DNA binding protein